MLKLKKTLLIILIFGFTLANFHFLEGNLDNFNSESCESAEKIEEICKNVSTGECREFLEKCQEYFDKKSAEIEQDISRTEQEKKTLQNQIYSLRQKIQSLDYQIYQGNLGVKDLNLKINDTQLSINKISLKIEDSKSQLASILRVIYEEEQKSLIEVVLEGDFSSFFDNLTNLESLNSRLQDILENTKSLKDYLGSKKGEMADEKDDLESLVRLQQLQKEESDRVKKEQEYFLKLTEGEYQKQLEEKKKIEEIAAEIRSRIFELIGVPEAPTFGEAYGIAKWVEGVTGVRPALLLAVLQQESAIGKNVGQCYVTNLQTGSGVNIRTGVAVNNVMKPMGLSGRRGDTDDFVTITSELNRKWNETPVSCPIPSVGGYGGAMGPAQFIPTTWMAYRDRLASIIGRPASPWNVKDAFLAAGLYLSDYGAKSQTRNGEWRAAMIYFSGSTNPRYSFYADSVLRIADQFQKDVEILEASK